MNAKDILKRYRIIQSTIGEVLVKESKRDIESWLAIEQIRQYLNKNGIKRKEHSQLEQALDRLEQLEKENLELQKEISKQSDLIERLNRLVEKALQENQELKEDLRLTTIERTNCENTFEVLEEQYLKCKNVIKNEITLLEERKESYYYSEWYDTAKVIGIIIDELKGFLCNV